MGLSSSKTKTKTSSNEKSTVTPTNPPWVEAPLRQFTADIGDFGNINPSRLVPGASELQRDAFQGAENLGSWQQGFNELDRGPNHAAFLSLGPAAQATSQGYTAPTVGPMAQAQAGSASAAEAARVILEAVQKGEMTEAEAQSMMDNFEQYQNPATQALVDTTLADYDQDAGRTRAAQAAQAAKNGAFGGSRYGIQEAQTEGELARGRASTDAQVRNQAFAQAVGMAQYDASNRQNTSLHNSQLATNTSLANAQMGNQHNQYQGGLDQSRNLANAQMQTNVSMGNAANQTQAGIANAGFTNQGALAQAGFDAQAARDAAQWGNDASLANAGFQNQFSLNNAQMGNQMTMFNAGQRDTARNFDLTSLAMQADNSRQDLAMQADLGAQQRGIEQQQALAPLMQLDAMANLYGQMPYDLFRGQTGTSNMTGTNTTTQGMNLFQSLLIGAERAAQAAAAGG